jgi:hypothetical protein
MRQKPFLFYYNLLCVINSFIYFKYIFNIVQDNFTVKTDGQVLKLKAEDVIHEVVLLAGNIGNGKTE